MRHQITFTQPSMTKQSFKEECDINNIMARYQQSGVVDHFNRHQANYRDTTGPDFTESMTIVANAKSMFEELPSKARKHFHNDPREFLDYVNSDEMTPESLTALGLADATLEAPLPVAPVDPETPPAASPEPAAGPNTPISDPE